MNEIITRLSPTIQAYDNACRMLEKARSTDEAKTIRDEAMAMKVYARQAKNRQLEADAISIRLRAERRLGQIIDAQRKSVGLNKGTLRRGLRKNPRGDERPTLSEAGIDKNLAHRGRKFAAMTDKQFASLEAQAREQIENFTVRRVNKARREKSSSASPIATCARKVRRLVLETLDALPVEEFENLLELVRHELDEIERVRGYGHHSTR